MQRSVASDLDILKLDLPAGESYDSCSTSNIGRRSLIYEEGEAYVSGEEQQSEEYSNRRSDLSLNTKEMITNMYRNFTAKAEDDRMLHSITPRSSFESDEYSNRSSSTFNFSLAERQLKNTQNRESIPSMVGSVIDNVLETEQFSEIEWGRTVESFVEETDEFSPG